MYSMLAGVMTLLHIHKKYQFNATNSRRLYLYSDNKALIHKVKNRRKVRRTVNQHRDSDVDLELQLLKELRELEKYNYEISISFVRYHQELKKVKAQLSHEETMNVTADKLTKEARKCKTITQYLNLPMNPITLFINKWVFNSKYSHRSIIVYHSIQLRQYFKEKHHRSDYIIDQIWWKIYHQLLPSLDEFEKTNIIKFIHDKMPTNKREHQHYQFKDEYCNLCQGSVEDEDHIIQRKNLRTEWLTEIKVYLSKDHTPPSVKDVIYNKLHAWLEPIIDTTNYEEYPDLQKAIKQQDDIGWRHFIRGRLTIEWGNIIAAHLETCNIKQYNAEKWAANLLEINWKYILKIWRQRCEDVHGVTKTDMDRLKKEKLLKEIKHIQSTNKELLTKKTEWIHEDIEELSKVDNSALEAGLYGANIVSKINKKKMKQS